MAGQQDVRGIVAMLHEIAPIGRYQESGGTSPPDPRGVAGAGHDARRRATS
jgi:hypothetical protein